MKKLWTLLIALISMLALPASVFAADGSVIDTGDTSFIIISTALVLLMTPGLALFYGGMVRKKNVLSTTMHSFIIMALASVQWVVIGFTLAFGPDQSGFIGALNWLGLSGVGIDPNPDYAATIPFIVFMAFQMMFAIITPALITGSIAERMRFPAFLVFILLWMTFVYDPLAHWVWGVGGFLRTMGALDFAGGTVVHISSGVSGLVAALVLGKRKGYGKEPMAPHQIPMTVLGAGLLWFGWFGFNAGSALGANGLAGIALVTTNTSAAIGALAWMAAEWLHRGKPTVLGAASGAVAGLVAITPGAGFVTPMASILIGLVGGIICYFAVSVLKAKLGYDDALDAFGCHGIGGIWGALATGLFATKTINPAGADGLLYGNPTQLGIQALSVVVTIVLAAAATFVILKGVGVFIKLRATDEEEETGLDLSMHGEEAYSDFIGNEILLSVVPSKSMAFNPIISKQPSH
ncbi:ammonium transporter [Desulfitobacterium metallireducens]|uniref:Ammonium transporter n=1 Tax=Desulfitobacterium metallireducens DSM 15288 TaxID=871968 RepID=W0EAL7_9FIRM|nr:ammonium transporter [Desulfitobacterium metallireducens]AHF06106.1 ammonia channel protein [Desulfitobacterium metallireducens DSM 15288]